MKLTIGKDGVEGSPQELATFLKVYRPEGEIKIVKASTNSTKSPRKRRKYTNGATWTHRENYALLTLRKQAYTWAQIAKKLKRSAKAVQARYYQIKK